MGLLDFFLQTKRDEEELLLLRITGTVALLLAESDPEKFKKNFHHEYIKRVMCATRGTENAVLFSCKKLSKELRGWDLIMNPYDQYSWNTDVDQK